MESNYVDLEHLTVALEWLEKQRPASSSSRFSLFRIAFDDHKALGYAFGAADAMRRLNTFGNILASTIRSTDWVARKLSVFWILTPDCNTDMVACRLCEVAVKIKEVGLDLVPCSISVYSSPLPLGEAQDATPLLDRLEKVQAAYKFEPARQCPVFSSGHVSALRVQWHGKLPGSCPHLQTLELQATGFQDGKDSPVATD